MKKNTKANNNKNLKTPLKNPDALTYNQPLVPPTAALFQPLATRMRPQSVQQFIGQSHLLAANKPLRIALDKGILHSMILWGPPGSGKTTLAQLIANNSHADFKRVSAVMAGVKDIREIVKEAQQIKEQEQRQTILFLDEVHRFNKAQQDIFLPYIEDGTFIFIGATTENPSFELNSALLSRCRVYVLKPLTEDELLQILQSVLTNQEYGLGKIQFEFPLALQKILIQAADGDARQLLNLMEIIGDLATTESTIKKANTHNKQTNETAKTKIATTTLPAITVTPELLTEVIQLNLQRFDKQGDVFYDQISALHKSVRGSAPDAALYWLCRMLAGGCDPRYISRRVIRMASEDISLADPRALTMAMQADDVYARLGSPEGELAIAEAIVYLACAAKSNAVYLAFNQAQQDAAAYGSLAVPIHLRNAPTKLMKDLDYGKAYRYTHDEPYHYAAGENYFPTELKGTHYYNPTENGLEIKIKEKLDFLKSLDQKSK